jgi:hypothetical protein
MRARFLVEILSVQILLAISVGDVWAACINPAVSAQSISQFKSNPRAFVAPDSDTRTIEAFVRDLVGTDASLATDFVSIAKETTPRYRTAIAAGLAQAAIACSTVDQQAGLLIQQAVASFDNGEFQAAFAAVAGDLSTAATAAALSSATSGFGSVVVTNPNTSTGTTTQFGGGGSAAPIVFTAPAIGVTTNNVAPTAASNVATTAASQVSPTR